MMKTYVTPQVDVIEVDVESGFNASGETNLQNFSYNSSANYDGDEAMLD